MPAPGGMKMAVKGHHDLDTELAIDFAKLELAELEHGKRQLDECPGIKQLATLMGMVEPPAPRERSGQESSDG